MLIARPVSINSAANVQPSLIVRLLPATNKAAAAQLFLSPKTIEKHLGSTYTKLGLSSRSELARLFAGQEHQVPA